MEVKILCQRQLQGCLPKASSESIKGTFNSDNARAPLIQALCVGEYIWSATAHHMDQCSTLYTVDSNLDVSKAILKFYPQYVSVVTAEQCEVTPTEIRLLPSGETNVLNWDSTADSMG